MTRAMRPMLLLTIASFLMLAAWMSPSGVEAQASAPASVAKSRGGDGLVLGIPLGAMNLTPEQDKRVSQILAAYRVSTAPLIGQLRQSQSALADKLLVPTPLQASDLQPELQQITRLRTQLLEQSAQAMVDIRGVLTPAQVAAGAQVRARLGQLRSEMRQILEPGQP